MAQRHSYSPRPFMSGYGKNSLTLCDVYDIACFMAGRNTILNKKMIRELCKIIRDGNYDVVACKLVGISQAAFYDWYAKGLESREKGEYNIYVEFAESLDKARAQSEDKCVKYIAKNKDWKARGWFLSRKFPERWGESQEIKHTGNINITNDTDLTGISEEDLLAALERKRKEEQADEM